MSDQRIAQAAGCVQSAREQVVSALHACAVDMSIEALARLQQSTAIVRNEEKHLCSLVIETLNTPEDANTGKVMICITYRLGGSFDKLEKLLSQFDHFAQEVEALGCSATFHLNAYTYNTYKEQDS